MQSGAIIMGSNIMRYSIQHCSGLGGWFNIKMPSNQYRKSIVEIRRSYDRLISTMGFLILVRRHLYIESGPRYYPNHTVYSQKTPHNSPLWLIYEVSIVSFSRKLTVLQGHCTLFLCSTHWRSRSLALNHRDVYVDVSLFLQGPA